MQKRHQVLLSNNHEFLVSEIPMDATMEAIRGKRILNWHDFEQLKTLRHQGRRAIARYFLAVLPQRGSRAFQAFLESLQEANAQHLVDLLLQQAGATNLEDLIKADAPEMDDYPKYKGLVKTPSDTPLPRVPDPHEYAVKLSRNARIIREFVDPAQISPLLAQNRVLTARETDMVVHLNGRNKKWDLIMAALLQRGERAYQAFMAALLQKDYSTVFHTIQETTTEPSGSDNDEGFSGRSSEENVESDEEVTKETVNLRKRQSLADDLLRDSTASKRFSTADDILLKRSSDLINTDHSVEQSSGHKMKNDSSLRDVDNNDRSGDNGADSMTDNGDSEHSDKVKNGSGLDRGQRGKGNNSILNSVDEEVEY